MAKNNKEEYNLLELTPIRNFEHETNDKGLINILVPKFKNSFLKRLIPSSKSQFIRANLDELGTCTWLAMDGSNNVSKIADIVREKFGIKAEPIFDRLKVFMLQLERNGFIYFKELKR